MDSDLTKSGTGSAYLRRVLTFWGLLVAILLVVLMTALSEPFEPDGFGPGQDARAYWAAPLADPTIPARSDTRAPTSTRRPSWWP